MLRAVRIAAADRDRNPPVRPLRALSGRSIAAVALVTLSLSLGPMYSGELASFFTPLEIVVEWLHHFAELAVVAGVLLLGYTTLDESLGADAPMRRLFLCTWVAGLSVLLTVLLYAYYAQGFEHLPPPRRLLADSLRFGLPAIFLVLVADAHRRAIEADAAARAAERLRADLTQDAEAGQLELLQAQIEPHFLFNVLGSIRRLYRTQPRSGSDTLASLMRYLQAALPQMRRRSGTLGDELDLARAYLDLCKVRMGSRLTYSIEADSALRAVAFPAMLVVTLVENAVKHGLEPVGGGELRVCARRVGSELSVEVLDDGAGFGSAGAGGTGTGLVSVRRRLAAEYPGEAGLKLAARSPRGACATIRIPWPQHRIVPGRAAATP
jgi:hypothetical protein